jgi:hypothetical protein
MDSAQPSSHVVREQATAAADELNAAMGVFVANAEPLGTDVDKVQRRRIIEAAQKLIRSVKNPADEWMDTMAHTSHIVAQRLFTEWKVWDEIPVEGSISYADLAAKVNGEESLICKRRRPPKK